MQRHHRITVNRKRELNLILIEAKKANKIGKYRNMTKKQRKKHKKIEKNKATQSGLLFRAETFENRGLCVVNM